MSEKMFPRTEVGGVSLSRMIMGTNWMLGWSHTGLAADNMIKRRYADKEPFKAMLEAYLSHGVDTIMAPFSLSPVAPELVKAIRETGSFCCAGCVLNTYQQEPSSSGQAA